MTGENDASVERPENSSSEAAVLSGEVAAILSSPALRRAPILSRLLRYLLEQTIAGTGDKLKAYTVAVDGLARSADFDAQLDSYPRVQIVRLRKALEHYYAENPGHEGPCVYLGSGSYRLRIGDRATAYPGSAAPAASALAAPWPKARWPVSMKLGVGLAASIAIVALIGVAITALRDPAPAQRASPVVTAHLVTMPVVALTIGEDARSQRARAVATTMSDGLRRSWVARVRDETVVTSGINPPPAYRVLLREGAGDDLAVELIDVRSGTVLWTGSAPLAANANLRTELASTIAMISSPFGVIARAETARLREGSTGSYACILRYFAFVKSRDTGLVPPVDTCLKQPGDDPRLEATADAISALFVLESRDYSDRTAQIAKAEQFARSAAAHNAEDAYAQLAMARIAYIQGRCPAAGSHADRAVLANPYDSVLVTVLAGLASQCDNPKAADLLDWAYRIRNDNEASMRPYLILATLAQGQPERLKQLGFMLRPPSGPQLGSYLLSEALIAAAQGRTGEAAARWSEFRNVYPDAGPSDDDRLKVIIRADPLRHRVLRLMRENGVIGPAT